MWSNGQFISSLLYCFRIRTNGRALALLLQRCVCLSSVTICIVAKRCDLEQKLLLTAYTKSYMRHRCYQNERPWPLFRDRLRSCRSLRHIRHCHSPLHISETVKDRGLVLKEVTPIRNGLWGIKWSHDRWRHVTIRYDTIEEISVDSKAEYTA